MEESSLFPLRGKKYIIKINNNLEGNETTKKLFLAALAENFKYYGLSVLEGGKEPEEAEIKIEIEFMKINEGNRFLRLLLGGLIRKKLDLLVISEATGFDAGRAWLEVKGSVYIGDNLLKEFQINNVLEKGFLGGSFETCIKNLAESFSSGVNTSLLNYFKK